MSRTDISSSKTSSSKTSSSKTPSSKTPSSDSTLLYGLSLLGALASGWAVFLWYQLMVARSGAKPFCGFGDSGDCAALWDAEFAARIHDLSGLPVAGWGVVWGVAAAVIPLFALTAKSASRPLWLRATRWIAGLGALGIVVLLGISAQAGLFCISCSITYVLTLGYAGGALFGLPKQAAPMPWLQVGAMLGVAWLVLLFPGRETPKNLERAGQQALSATATTTTDDPATPAEEAPSLEEFIAELDPRLQQSLSDTLGAYRQAPEVAGQPTPSHFAIGDAGGEVLITEFTDTLCSHCATLHGTMAYLDSILPDDRFAVDARHFPLDGNCNPHLEIRGPESVRCLAAKARICLADAGHGIAYDGSLYQVQRSLTESHVYDFASPYMDRSSLEACVHSEETATKLAADVEFAWLFEPHGTPLVLVNGREGNAFGPFLFALILAGGDADHPAFDSLPEPDPNALEGSHAGHAH